jgi:hypothetical protein
MGQNLYFTVFVGLLVVCALAAAAWRPPKRPCPACGNQNPLQNRRCRHCGYSFGRS